MSDDPPTGPDAGVGSGIDLSALTIARFPEWPGDGVFSIDEIRKGGSGRRYFRLARGGRSIIVMVYDLERAENADFAPITDFLASAGVAVPTIEARDEERRVLWIEDLGETDLWHLRHDDWESVRRPTYEATLQVVARIHALTEERIADRDDLPHFQPPFDAGMYRWEQDYFFERFIERFSAADADARRGARESRQLSDLIDGLTSLPRTLVHRDFQSQNIMLCDGVPRLIDYQGMRFGRPEYDLASLIFDPYVPLSHDERRHLITFAHGISATGDDFAEFEDRLLRCAAQRLMQALGAYGFLGIDRGLKPFLAHIPPAIENLRWIAVERAVIPALAPVLKLDEIGVA